MKADRLVATLLLLQARGRVTVREVAEELEVSERTARRDLEALTSAGVPVYSQRGRGGGWSLVGGARTDLTGFTSREIGALFLAAGPLSASPELRAALRKLMRAVPAPMRPHAEAASKAILVDGLDWSRTAGGSGPHRHALERAVLDGRQVLLGYAYADRATAEGDLGDDGPGRRWPVERAAGERVIGERAAGERAAGERTVDPLGLVSKAGRWYLVAGTGEGLRTFRLSRVTSVEPTGAPVLRPEGFELAAAWRELVSEVEQRLSAASVRAHADPDALPVLRQLLGGRLRTGEVQPDGRVAFTADGPSVEVLAAQLAGLGARIEVLDPPEARESLVRLGRSLTAVYGGQDDPRRDSRFPLGTYYVHDASVPVMAANR
ncbi:WYL domain-containing protein [Streptomyces fagopyri]|uniref:WYL domain-containing protein n=1 Tax=Streptomyces fagopyri TaxID=2662397 RepID=A0A5Q0LDX8_9ACTN|nr:WYL domain-containing protein [Streptomyces fagopyri]QFZ75302.1 WYL domain-containing protein [Streptomyces fagopyri]